MEPPFFISHNTPAIKPVHTLLESSNYNRSPQPHLSLPLPLPVKEQPKFSLPSISTLFGDADSARHAAKHRRLSPSGPNQDIQCQPYELPPPPSLRLRSGNNHSKSHHSPSGPNTKPDTHPHRFSISSTRSIHLPHSTAAPYAPPTPSVSSHSSPVDVLQPTKYHTRPPATASFQPALTVTALQKPQPHIQAQTQQQQPRRQSSSALISPVTLAWQHHYYFPPSNSDVCHKNRDRYICRTCRKASSCPFWPRSHFHSRTCEKSLSFRCTHAGCGKTSSVRNNLNRHKRDYCSSRPTVGTVLVV
ncbi:hypothetical protein N7516_008978 [Penicillium verrucosum]|uniref:uncharacterized protein n=1 Tax=Penicillium verrucosum TaxID=60171 RepID=UPI0025453C13|nr:uncharacterized protein N7516_008978 [Penicillium verrucosum]KAJ5927205.1 hypothetical protein N7516_008978 [Penicillium verrucosum]